ncbi:MAG: four helix bundle protein [Alphaproteobacteria bacterium]
MAQYQHLPIYKQTYDILLRTMSATKDFPREYKFTLGQKIKDELIELVVVIYRANSAADKKQHIQSILERVQAIQLMMRLAHDMRILPRRHYAALSEMTDSLARQAQGWLNKSCAEGGAKSSGKGKPERVAG